MADPRPSDLLSSLPLDMRSEILSFLPPLCTVQTCVLSVDWEHSWKYLRGIYLDDKAPFNRVERLLMFRDQLMGALEGECLDRFCLHFRLPSLVPITSWIDDAICRHVSELDLEVPDLDMPASFFTCGTLSKLRLRLVRFVMDEEQVSWHRDLVVNLPSLSFFDTFAHQIVAANVIRIIQGSPSLKSVKLSGCCFLPLVAPMPKSLNVNTLDFVNTTVHGSRTIFHMLDNCPSLKHLSVGKLEESDWARPKPPSCMTVSLKTLEVTYFSRCDKPEFNFLIYVLSNAIKLKKLKVRCTYYMPSPKMLMMRTQLQNLISLSHGCHIFLYGKQGVEVIM
ncbi:putative FBD domain, leucine-rich repeat domain superfamily, F-box-like domain superfamily [Helianthus annuus]|nr:putative FBD domain, leucine-rich repeat domain superfamily, F-box-like domain superfamily [Helianthus annuus]